LVEKILMKFIKSLFSLFFIFVMLMVAIKGMALQTFILLGERSFALFKNSLANMWIIFMVIALIIITVFSRRNSRNEVYTFPFFSILALIIVTLLSSSINTDTSFSFTQSFWILFSSYLSLFVLLVMDTFKFNKINPKTALGVLIFFNIFQMVLGFFQYIKTNPIFAVYYKGEPILNPIFYLNGISSSNSYFLALGAKVRAFGMTDSGLTLGLISMFMLSLVIFSKKISKFLKLVLSILCLLVIFMTLTRVVYLSSMVLLFFAYLIKTNRYKILKISYYVTLIVQILFTSVLQETAYSVVNFISNGTWNIDSLKSRIAGVHFFWDISSMNIWKFLFGSNITAHLDSIQTPYSIDNEFFKIFLDIGVLGYSILIIFFTKVLFKYVREVFKSENKNNIEAAFVCFLLTFPFLGISNVVNYFYFPMFTILLSIKSHEFVTRKGPNKEYQIDNHNIIRNKLY
jgi:hypothetical protein